MQIWGDPAGRIKDGVAMRTYFDHLSLAGLHAMPAPTNDIDVRIQCIKTPMTRFYNGQPGIIISPSCVVLIEALEEKWNYKRLNVAGEVRFDDKPNKYHPWSDACDALGYLLMGGGEHRILTTGQNAGNVQPHVMDMSWDVI